MATVRTRFAPEPSGYLHLGHLKAIHINYQFARQHGGEFIVRMDDSNPVTCQESYADNILRELDGLGIEYQRIAHMSSYLDQVEEFAKQLVERELAYVDDLPPEDLNQQRHAQQESLNRQNGRAENLALWQEMVNGQAGRYLRLKIDMKHENGIMRDPVVMTVRNQTHYRTGHRAIYPMYDFISPILDALLGVTHVFRSNEFTERSELHQWILDRLNLPKPEFHTFLRLNLENTILSKRKLRQLVSDGVLTGWDDPQSAEFAGGAFCPKHFLTISPDRSRSATYPWPPGTKSTTTTDC